MLESGTIQPRVHDVMWLCWSERKTEACASALTSAILMPARGRIPTPCCRFRGIGESGRCWTFFVPGPQIGILANKNGGGIKTVYCLYDRQFGIFWMWPHALWAMQCTSHVSEAYAKLSRQTKPHLLSHLLRYNHILADCRRASPPVACSLQLI